MNWGKQQKVDMIPNFFVVLLFHGSAIAVNFEAMLFGNGATVSQFLTSLIYIAIWVSGFVILAKAGKKAGLMIATVFWVLSLVRSIMLLAENLLEYQEISIVLLIEMVFGFVFATPFYGLCRMNSGSIITLMSIL
jgi:hypothetical protein